MKVNSRLIALMVAMAAGTAAAASAGTTAGLAIQNVAQASFTNPAYDSTQPTTPSNNPTGTTASNPVYTTVNAIPAFDILYTDGSADGTTASTPPTLTEYDALNVLPGSTVTTRYTVANNGNVDGYVVNLAPDTTGTANAPTSVLYYLATDTTFTTPITSVTLTNGGSVAIVQRILIPTNAAVNTTYSASPHGTAAAGSISTTLPDNTVITTPYNAVDEANNVNTPVTPAANNDLEFTRATIFTPTVVTTPPTIPAGTVVITPPTTNPVDPTNPVSPPGTPIAPSDPSAPGYVATPPAGTPVGTPGTPIVVDPTGNNQTAYPPADTNTAPDTVIFNNVVTTPVGAPADTVNLFPTVANPGPSGGAPTSVYDPVTKGFPITTPNGPALVQFLDPVTLLPLPTATDPISGLTFPILTIPVGGGTVPYLTSVTYPDSNSVTDPMPVVVTVGVDSKNDSDVLSNGITTDTIYPPAAAFGDVPASGTTADPALIGAGNIAQVVVPGTTATTGAPSPTAVADSSAVFPMTINNTGEYNDTYTLVGTVPIKNADGTTTLVTVKYVDPTTGLPLDSGAPTAVAVTLPNGVIIPAGTATYITPLVPANSNYVASAIIDVPSTAAATTGLTGINPNPVVSQSAVGNFSTIPMADTNDQIQVGVIGGITVAKTQNANGTGYVTTPATALPGQSLSYKILAKNTYNTPVYNFVLADGSANGNNAYAVTNFVSASATALLADGTTSFGTVYYKVNGGTFTTTAPAAGTVITSIEVAVDNSAPTGIDAADFVPAGATIELTINTTVK
jgi:hypothetical protein